MILTILVFDTKENSEGGQGFIMKGTTAPPHESSTGKQISSDSKVMSCGEGPDICSLISPTLNQETGYGTLPNPYCPEIYSIHSTRDRKIAQLGWVMGV